MINITLIDVKAFQIDTAVLPRQFQTILNRSNRIILRNIKTGYRINLGVLSNVLIEGQPATLEGIRKIVYNFSCSCTGDGGEIDYKIFGVTFDNTFQ